MFHLAPNVVHAGIDMHEQVSCGRALAVFGLAYLSVIRASPRF